MKNGSGRRAPAAAPEPASDKVIRCAIYTRKSTEEGLQQDFSSLDAQREAGEAFIASQRNEGWQLVPERFDDGGFTGGNMDRPALKRLLAAIEAGRVTCVVVYKVDRLSRSLMDFSRMMESFDRSGASFVSVTQQFNTTNSLGRLTLNILLSFAQFERELISERTRDKMCAARKKGKWIGGHPVLGYDIDTKARRLIVNRDEAHQVRTIFDQYLETGAMLPVLQDLDLRGWRTKQWTTEAGQTRGGKPFTKSLLYGMLTNAIYTGQVNHKGTLFPGEHEAIIERATWERAQDMLDRNGRTNGAGAKNKYGALLRGLLFCVPCGTAMVHTYSVKGNKRYLAGPTSITLTTAWQRFKITGTLAGGQTGLWIVVRQFAGNGDNWTSGAIFLWGACLQLGNDPKSGYARTWASQTAFVSAGVACGAVVISAKDNAESPLRIYGSGSNLADHRLLEVTAGGELILAGGTGNGYRLAELMGASNPSGWFGVLKVKTPAGATAGLFQPVIPERTNP